jgi:hypothetical protein
VDGCDAAIWFLHSYEAIPMDSNLRYETLLECTIEGCEKRFLTNRTRKTMVDCVHKNLGPFSAICVPPSLHKCSHDETHICGSLQYISICMQYRQMRIPFRNKCTSVEYINNMHTNEGHRRRKVTEEALPNSLKQQYWLFTRESNMILFVWDSG